MPVPSESYREEAILSLESPRAASRRISSSLAERMPSTPSWVPSANECSGNPASGGVAAVGNFLDQTDQRGGPVGLPVSGNTPGASLGAEGDNALINNQSDRC